MFIPIIIFRILLGLLALTPSVDSIEPPEPTRSDAMSIPTTVPPTTVPPAQPETEVGEPVELGDGPEHGKLTVSQGQIHLPANVYSGSFELTNTGGQPVDWEWIRGPEVHTATPSGTLVPGESVVVAFEIDPAGFAAGPNLSATCVIHDDGAVDIWITSTKVLLGGPGDLVAP